MASKKINWPAIKKRYLLGGKPKDIAVDYGLTAKQVSVKANKENWKRKKEKLGEKIETEVEATLESVNTLAVRVAKKVLQELLDGELSRASAIVANKALEKAWPDKNSKNATSASNTAYRREYYQSQLDSTANGNFAGKPILPLAGGDSRETQRQDNSSD